MPSGWRAERAEWKSSPSQPPRKFTGIRIGDKHRRGRMSWKTADHRSTLNNAGESLGHERPPCSGFQSFCASVRNKEWMMPKFLCVRACGARPRLRVDTWQQCCVDMLSYRILPARAAVIRGRSGRLIQRAYACLAARRSVFSSLFTHGIREHEALFPRRPSRDPFMTFFSFST